jgi:protein gp37
MANTRIEWTEKTWNPITGCTKISEGCKHCYAERMSKRLAGRCGYDKDEPFKVTLHPDKLDEPLRWRKPSKIFVCSMGDLFHEDVPFSWITEVFDVMCSWRWPNKEAERLGEQEYLVDPKHTYMVLTKRPERVDQWLDWVGHYWPGDSPLNINLEAEHNFGQHIWLGVTAENQQRADERIPILLQIPAAKRFVSVEPMLGPVDLTQIDIGGNVWINSLTGDCKSYHPYGGMWKINESKNKLDWIICGGETGPGARPMRSAWVISLRDQCQEAGTPFFFKSWGEWVRPSQMPASTYREIEDYGNGIGIADVPLGVGKKRSGRAIDGDEWNEYPEEG